MSECSESQWYVVRSQTKREMSAAAYIRKELGLEVIAPQVSYIKSTVRGKVNWREAMFPGYLFVKFVREEMERAVCYAPGVLTLVRFGDYVPHVGDSFVQSLRDVVGGEEMLALDRSVQIGEVYQVSDGPMQGSKGEVVKVLDGGARVRLLLEFIGEEREVDMDLYSLLLSKRPDVGQ